MAPDPTLEELRQRFTREFACLPGRHKTLRSPGLYEVQISEELERLLRSVVGVTRERELGTAEEATTATPPQAQGD
jgi:hypothetical protein